MFHCSSKKGIKSSDAGDKLDKTYLTYIKTKTKELHKLLLEREFKYKMNLRVG